MSAGDIMMIPLKDIHLSPRAKCCQVTVAIDTNKFVKVTQITEPDKKTYKLFLIQTFDVHVHLPASLLFLEIIYAQIV